MISIEVVHHMKANKRSRDKNVAFKLDINKAYDRIDWLYLKELMLKMSFVNRWVQWILMCRNCWLLYYCEKWFGRECYSCMKGFAARWPFITLFICSMCRRPLNTYPKSWMVRGPPWYNHMYRCSCYFSHFVCRWLFLIFQDRRTRSTSDEAYSW